MTWKRISKKSLIQRKKTQTSISKGNQKRKITDRKGRRYNTHLMDSKSQTICSFCREGEHVAINRATNSKKIQYYSCETFTQMKPKATFHELQKQKLCFQCLYPRAYKEKYQK